MGRLLRPALLACALPLSLATIVLCFSGRWPWYPSLPVAVALAGAVAGAAPLRRRPMLFAAAVAYVALILAAEPLGRLLRPLPPSWLWAGGGLAVATLVIWRTHGAAEDLRPAVRLGTAGLGRPVTVGLDDRFLHMHVLGPTGSGKTRGVLWPLVRQDIRLGHGLLLLDPKGDLARPAVGEARRLGRKVTDLAPATLPELGLDPFAGAPERAAETVAYALFGAFPSQHEFYRSVGQAMLRHAALALKEAMGDPTLLDLAQFLRDEEMRREVLLAARSGHVRAYFRDEVGSWSPRFRQDAFIGVQSALSEILAHPWARALFTQRPACDFDRLLAEGDMLCLELPEGEIGLGARAIGAFALLLFQAAALRRTEGPAAFVYADEFQTFAQADFGSFLAQARSHRVGAILAHQHLGQLNPGLRLAVLANARNRVLLGGLSREDLEQLRESLGERPSDARPERPRFSYETVRRLPRGRAIGELAHRGQIRAPLLVRLPRG